MRKNLRGWALLLVVLAVVAALVGCSAPSSGGSSGTTTSTPAAKGPIRVGSKIDIEGPLLAQIMIAMLQKNGFTVQDMTRTGATDVVRKALLSGQIDMYPEYTANGVLIFLQGQKIDPAVLKDATQTYQTVKTLDLQVNNVVWLQPAPANNTWTVALTKTFAAANHIVSMADWAAYINSGKAVKIVGSQEFFTSPAAMPAFEKAYGFTLKPAQIVALATGDTAATEKAVSQGTSGANAAMAYGTDGTIAAYGLVTLTDPKGAQPIYQPAPTVRKAIFDKYPELATILDPVFAKLDTATLQTLNGQIAVDGKDPKTVATTWLTQQGFLP
jgi:osmoprotectant transport system substrate-binding protein